MDSNYLQQQRFLLQKKVKRLNSCDYKIFHSLFVQFWSYLRNHAIYAGVLAKLASEAPAYTEELTATCKGEIYLWETDQEAVNFNFRLLEHCASKPVGGGQSLEAMIGRKIAGSSKFSEMLDGFRDTYLEPFYEYLDEALDNQKAVLSLLLKYKRHVEWFKREEVNALILKGGERTVAKHMYAYLFDQGLDFHIEPQSISGEADLVAPELVLDAKLFDGSSHRGKKYLLSGVNQLLTYTRDYFQQVGYLVVYRTCREDLQFSFSRSDMLVPFMVIDGRVIYFLIIDVCEYGTSASKRGLLRTHVIDEDDVRAVIKEPSVTDSSSSVTISEPVQRMENPKSSDDQGFDTDQKYL